MNPLLLAQLNRLKNNLRSLGERERQLRDEADGLRAENERLTKVLFRHERERNTLQLNQRAYEDLKARHDRLAAVNREVGERAARLAALATALIEGMDP